MSLSIFPDINVWVALAYSHHVHHRVARRWYESLAATDELIFCRHTQMGFLRLLTNPAIMGEEAKSQVDAWLTYDAFFVSPSIRFMSEPGGIERRFRQFARSVLPTSQDWADSYLAAFAEQGALTLATFDKKLSARVPGSRLLKA